MGFTKIYNSDSVESNHFPVDIQQTNDGGYYFLGYNLQAEAKSMIIRTDNDGKLLWSHISNQYLNPVSDLIKVGDNYYFVCAKNLTFEIAILRINETSKSLEEVKLLDESKKPLAACATPDKGILILAYDFPNSETVLIKLNSSFELDNSFSNDGKSGFQISQLEIMDDRINNHMTFQGTRLPFFVSYIGEPNVSSYVFNGVNEYDITLTAINPITGEPQGKIDGFRYKKCMSSFCYLGNNKAAMSKFEDVNNYFAPSFNTLEFTRGNFINISDLSTLEKREIQANSQIKCKLTSIAGRKIVIYVAELKNNTVGLFAYDAANGTFAGARYFGSTNAYKIGNITTTSDGGLAVLCQTYVAGRFGRMCLFKLSKEQTEEFIK
ncbi:MAG: hypothetical protein EAZ07_03340 [Cytophagales bacterium]|nr:MAG: hypothetical protein EAZ07_03340 [Cytophagales bacterium]